MLDFFGESVMSSNEIKRRGRLVTGQINDNKEKVTKRVIDRSAYLTHLDTVYASLTS